MVSAVIRDQLLSRMERLPLELQRRVLVFADSLARTEPIGASGEVLLSLAGTLDADSARQMIDAIEEGCEKVDENGW